MVFSVDYALFTLFGVAVLFSTEAWTRSDGPPRVIGSQQPVVAFLGDDVILPCRLEPSLNAEGLTVEWSRPDLEPDPSDRLSHVEYVLVYRDRHEVLDMKNRSYFGRTALFKEEMKRGNVSLKIANVKLEDGGRYKCYIPRLDSQWKDWTVQLVVEPERTTDSPLDPRNLPTADPEKETETTVEGGRSHLFLLIPLVLVLLVLGGGCFLKRRQKQTSPIVLERGMESKSLQTAGFPTQHV